MIIKKFGKKSINILLFGVSCVGKTTVVKLLADKLGWLFFDVDDGIVKHCGCSIGEFVDTFTCVERNDVRRSLVLEYLDKCPGNKVIVHFVNSFQNLFRRDNQVSFRITTRVRIPL